MAGEITDIQNTTQLIRYASVAQVAFLTQQHGITQEELAKRIGKTPSNFSRDLKKGLPYHQLHKVDKIVVAEAPEVAHTGGLSSLAVRLRRVQRDDIAVSIPPSWAKDLLSRTAADEFGVLLQGWALLSMFQSVEQPRQIYDEYRRILREVVNRLVLIGASPPTARNVDALILLGSIAGYAFDVVRPSLQEGITTMPLGFRVWRAITTILRLNQTSKRSTDDLKEWARRQLGHANNLRDDSLFPGRSLDLEAAIAIPPEWSPPGDDWVRQVLYTRAMNTKAVIRERGTAAHGLWERAIMYYDTDGRAELAQELRHLIDEFNTEADNLGDTSLGLRWIADTLRQNLDKHQAVCNSWPDSDESCLHLVREATSTLTDIPARILSATKTLLEHAVLQNAGVYRRQAVDTLLAGGWTTPVTKVLEKILKHEHTESWLRCRVLFALGMLQDRGNGVIRILQEAYDRALEQLGHEDSRGAASEMHAVLFAIGDCFGATGAQEAAEELREHLDTTLPDLLTSTEKADIRYRVARAAAYMVMVTAHARPSSSFALLENLRNHPDRATRNLSAWALRHRFGPTRDGIATVRPLHEA